MSCPVHAGIPERPGHPGTAPSPAHGLAWRPLQVTRRLVPGCGKMAQVLVGKEHQVTGQERGWSPSGGT